MTWRDLLLIVVAAALFVLLHTISTCSMPDFPPQNPANPSFHCKRCHRNITNKRPREHNEVCGGFASDCWPWCTYPTPDDLQT